MIFVKNWNDATAYPDGCPIRNNIIINRARLDDQVRPATFHFPGTSSIVNLSTIVTQLNVTQSLRILIGAADRRWLKIFRVQKQSCPMFPENQRTICSASNTTSPSGGPKIPSWIRGGSVACVATRWICCGSEQCWASRYQDSVFLSFNRALHLMCGFGWLPIHKNEVEKLETCIKTAKMFSENRSLKRPFFQ